MNRKCPYCEGLGRIRVWWGDELIELDPPKVCSACEGSGLLTSGPDRATVRP